MKFVKKLISILTIAAVMAVMTIAIAPEEARADIVTDTLTVKVGYYGMDASEYVEVATYNWWELEEALPLYYQAYSYYGSSTNLGSTKTVVDSAYGFLIKDLLEYAGIYMPDVFSVSFYTRDYSVGSWASFTSNELFGNDRYYFDNLAMHLKPIYNSIGIQTGIDDSEAWDYASVVQPMLALEDNWATFEVSDRETPPDYTNLSAGCRFRLLFGQHEPTSKETKLSAKYVHSVYVTLSGTAIYADNSDLDLDTSIGNHTAKMNITVSNENLSQALQSLLDFQSSDESILKITGWKIEKSGDASDLYTIEIYYEVYQAGDAYITGGFGEGDTLTDLITIKPDSGGSSGGDTPGGNDTPTEDETGTDDKNADSGSSVYLTINDDDSTKLDVQLKEDREAKTAVDVSGKAIPLTDELIQALLRSSEQTQEEEDVESVDSASDEVQAVKVVEVEKSMVPAMCAGYGTLALLVAGGIFAAVSYKRKRGH